MKTILIANRGEIALRVIRACRELGLESVAIYSQGDEHSPHVEFADRALCIGPAAATHSYLDVQAVLSAAVGAGADAIHPGYGFLAENPGFAQLCQDCGLTFVGPSPAAIEQMGNKDRARQTMAQSGVPVVPGSPGPVEDGKMAGKLAEKIGYPVLLKAASGGGGKGMRLVEHPGQMGKALSLTRKEAEAAFGDGTVYMEKYITSPRHVEIQILADNHGNVIHLGERDCSVQRRNQKLVEEAPCPVLDEDLRQQMGDAAVKAAQAVKYSGAGTVEFLLDADGRFYFMEMNTRIQVEHPVTEMITGIDLVKAQLLVAAGQQLDITQDQVAFNGWSIECRINAEDPAADFRPSPGHISRWASPGGPWVRVDGIASTGYSVSPHYDSLIAKIIVWGQDREEAISRMERALAETVAEGITTTVSLHQQIMADREFRSGHYDTSLLPRIMERLRR